MRICDLVAKCAKEYSLADFGVLKLCVGSAGIIAGLLVPKKGKTSVLAAASVVFSLTLIPLMLKLIRTANDGKY